jgi:hypothetical protein
MPHIKSEMDVVFAHEVYSYFDQSKPAWCPYAPGCHVMKKRALPNASRHGWALEMHGHLLAEALRRDTSAEAREVEKLPEKQIPARLVSLIMQKADPTQNKGMTAWLVGQYGQGKLRLEDLGTASETLMMFRRYAARLEPSQRDLGRYQNLAAVWEAVIGFANEEERHLSGKAQKALDRDKAYAESRILRQDPDGFTIAVPLTEFAAKWWGRGTRWCTAAEKHNAFLEYHKQAPLIVMVLPWLGAKGKVQFWSTKDEAQFMDAADEPVSEVLFAEYFPRFVPVLSFALRQNGAALKYVPETLRTGEMCRTAVTHNGAAQDEEVLDYVPQTLRTYDLCRLSVQKNGDTLHYVPQKLRTDAMCRIAVTQNGRALQYVPWDLRTEELCCIAVTQNGRALKYVPEDLRSEGMYRIAVAQNGEALKYVPEVLRGEEMCRIAVARHGRALEFVPWDLRTEEMCRIAVAENGWALEYAPQNLRTDEMCRIAVAQNGNALMYVPIELRTDEICRIAVAQDGLALEYVPDALRTEELCRIAVTQTGWALTHVPEDVLTDEMYEIAVAHNGRALEFVPEKLRTVELCRIAVAQNGNALMYVPRALRDRISALIPPPVPGWDISLLGGLASFLDTASPPAPSGPRHA